MTNENKSMSIDKKRERSIWRNIYSKFEESTSPYSTIYHNNIPKKPTNRRNFDSYIVEWQMASEEEIFETNAY